MPGTKRTALTMQERLDVLKDLETSSAAAVAEKYNVHRATIFRIRRNASLINQFDGQDSEAKQRQRIKKLQFQELEKHLFSWFVERKTVGLYTSDALLLEKATELNEEFGTTSQFKASRGWLSNFKKRNNIRLVRRYNGKSNASEETEEQFNASSEEETEELDVKYTIEGRNEIKTEINDDKFSEQKYKNERNNQGEEQRNKDERTQKQEVYYSADQIKKIEHIFSCLEEFVNLGPPSIRIHTDALKAHYLLLGEPSSNS